MEKSVVMVRKLRKIGGSISVNLPWAFIKANSLEPGQLVKIEYDLNTITITPSEENKKETT